LALISATFVRSQEQTENLNHINEKLKKIGVSITLSEKNVLAAFAPLDRHIHEIIEQKRTDGGVPSDVMQEFLLAYFIRNEKSVQKCEPKACDEKKSK
jgi:hypothetical protein